ncbi:isocitrate lyase/phosphoenolpyruvate mutase family protein [Bacillus haynesii]|uniref:isocitrate lyase/PEP mutase family protein n=1 Tax=Bacillus haynesii TaxID=1925021 RepID=UPI0022814520|nr:isocitrate lyase/phosphoenolpyruvate mutase family protein [Bacillus haynesii]MCY8003481.1 isocitrate lyase/phosphoenolpyruvate mutase family protein [Bacillus haynesii]MCY8340351.1 isocitrate lyase/phosphoenolpyruvate mutase family protein [Bacillus haynesii]
MKPFAKYKAFLDLHHQSGPFVLPNAWDAASAKAFQNCGFKAVGTTSAGIAMSLGYPDGEHLPFETLLSVLKTITDAVDIPVSADLEAGYGQSPETVAENVKKAAAAGVVGINIEDGTKDPCRPLCDATLMEEKITAVKNLNLPVLINARTDVYWLNADDPGSRLQTAVRRANRYRQAGADCIFIPGADDTGTIAGLRKGISGPLNVLAGSNTPSLQILSELGIERISCGSAPFRAALSLVKKIGEDIIRRGTFNHMTDGVLSYGEAADWISLHRDPKQNR